MFQRFFDEGLAQSSYLVGCPRSRLAAVIDPRRDVDVYAAAADQQGWRIAFAIETHIHADFVSGACELAAEGATIVAGPESALQFPHREVHEGDSLELGDIRLDVLHTPGHTPEHISIVVREPHAPVRVLTGDTLFVGAVGRPDLLGDAMMRRLAGDLHESLFRKLLALDDDVEVHPGHGAGSLCGSGISKEPSSTIGHERGVNPLLQHRDKQAFVTAVLNDLPETPPYFPVLKRVNREGPRVMSLARGVREPALLPPLEAARLVRDGAVLLDLRSQQAFGMGHPAGALNIAFGPKIGYWAGWIVPAGTTIVLILANGPASAAEATRQLLRVGLDAIAGSVAGGFEAWVAAGLPTATVAQISAGEFRDVAIRDAITIVDVRTAKEWAAGHIDGAVHIPLGELPRRLTEIPSADIVATICEGGLRSSLAASLLRRAGITRVVNVRDGMAAWRAVNQSVR